MKTDEINQLIERFEKSARIAREASLAWQRTLHQAHSSMQKLEQARDNLQQYFSNIASAIEKLPKHTKNELEALAAYGWYVDPDMPCSEATELANALLSGQTENAHSRLERYFHSNTSTIEQRLLSSHPSRAHLVSAAFRAHRDGLYALSVPVFLAQADGICNELLGVELYSKTRGGTSTKVNDTLKSQKLEPFTESLLAPVLTPVPINANSANLGHDSLNRHGVLHGTALNYDTFRNSCRSISLVSFTSWALTSAIHGA